jgi:penicillin-binding protein 1A
MGYEDPISTNPAMVLGGLTLGVTPVGWTYAYSTIGNNGDRVSGTLAPRPGDSPVSYTQVTDKDGKTIKGGDNDSTHKQVLDQGNAEEAKSILETVVSSGTGTHAQTGAEGEWGKTGTTSEEVDAWFCGGVSDEVTACVWVGYPNSATSMATLYNGGPVMGGTFPALIWAGVISAWEEIKAENLAAKQARKEGREASEGGESGSGETETYVPEETEAAPEAEEAPEEEATPEEEAAPEATPEATPEAAPESSGGGGGVTAG